MDSTLAEETLNSLYDIARDYVRWIKIAAVLLIVTGIPAAIVLVGLLNIWMGIILLQAATALDRGDSGGFLEFMDRIGRFFRLYAIVSIVGLILGAIWIAVFLTGMFSALGGSGLLT